MRPLFAIAVISLMSVVAAVNAGEPVQERPQVSPGNTLEPTVRVRPDDGATVKEWVKNGKLVAVRIEPKGAPAYYLVDMNGDGLFEPGPDFGDDGMVAQWVLFRF